MIRVLLAEDMQILEDALTARLRLEEDIEVVTDLLDGLSIVSAVLQRRTSTSSTSTFLAAMGSPRQLSSMRETDVVRHFATDPELAKIARVLNLSCRTGRNHLASTVTKLGHATGSTRCVSPAEPVGCD